MASSIGVEAEIPWRNLPPLWIENRSIYRTFSPNFLTREFYDRNNLFNHNYIWLLIFQILFLYIYIIKSLSCREMQERREDKRFISLRRIFCSPSGISSGEKKKNVRMHVRAILDIRSIRSTRREN